jgi:hypothetical protein
MRLLIVAYAVGMLLGSLSAIEWVVVRLIRWRGSPAKRARIAR